MSNEQNGMPAMSLEAMLANANLFPPRRAPEDASDPTQPSARMPPGMESIKQYTTDELIAEMNRTPLFMTHLDDAAEDNVALDALKAMAYEGTKAEIAGNFRESGNEMARAKKWKDAREYYSSAIGTLRMTDKQLEDAKGGGGPGEFDTVVVDVDDEEKKERDLYETCLVNRALCNLEMSKDPFILEQILRK